MKIGSKTDLDDSEVIISFVEYSKEFTRDINLESHDDSMGSYFLPTNLKPAYYTDETVVGGTVPSIVQKESATSTRTTLIPGQIMIDWMRWFNSSYTTYGA